MTPSFQFKTPLEAMMTEPESEPLLGAYTLEGLALAVDSLNERLVPRPWLPLFELLPSSPIAIRS